MRRGSLAAAQESARKRRRSQPGKVCLPGKTGEVFYDLAADPDALERIHKGKKEGYFVGGTLEFRQHNSVFQIPAKAGKLQPEGKFRHLLAEAYLLDSPGKADTAAAQGTGSKDGKPNTPHLGGDVAVTDLF